jgi:GTP-binding protein HflX
VGIEVKGRKSLWTLSESLEELALLTKTAGANVLTHVPQRVSKPSHQYLGSGKLNELKELQQQTGANLIICDDELTPTQQRSLESILEVKVIDRTTLILDVFSRNAHTREGQLQVALAQHQYLLPRLAGQWSHLERLGGGIGTRGPGETQLETDRRLIRRHIQHLERELQRVRERRDLYRRRRRHARIPVVSLVGYTNAGKSTLLNALSNATVTTENKLFSTLDPVTKLVHLSSGFQFLLTDTVGFIQKLSPTVIAAFRATLEELEESDLLLHVVDISQRRAAEQAESVDETLKELGLEETPRILVINKVDLLTGLRDKQMHNNLKSLDMNPSVIVSAHQRWNLDGLIATIVDRLGHPMAAIPLKP